ncbi:MAG: MBOAT family protein [Cyanobacteria bacterium REEB67]|nr:MBOAT family protein [Cyanobacteria bacterium REEB67]
MLFNSLQYLVFLPVVFFLYWATPHRLRVPLLLVASYAFYMSWRPIYGLLIFGLTLANFLLVPCIAKAAKAKEEGSKFVFSAKAWVGIIVAVNLVCLAIFKYAYFAMDTVKSGLGLAGIDWKEPHLHIILPLGISFFVFEFIHYAVEVYRGKPIVTSFPALALFAGFFPTQIAGPIKRYQDFVPQLNEKIKFKWEYLDQGMQMILMGLAKKVLLADNLALVAQAGFTHPENFSGVDLWLIAYAFAFQIFFDFAGYTDIARGSALLFGFKVPINFNLPYLSANVSEFWQRWHISLSSWLRDYLFIPLGGSRCSTLMQYRNLFITMALGGLWHGAAMHFLVWGAYQGIVLILHKEYLRLRSAVGLSAQLEKSPALARVYHWTSIVVTFHIVCVGWVFFRADDMKSATAIISKLLMAPVELVHFSAAKLAILQIRDPIIFPALVLLLPALMISHVVVGWLNDKKYYLSPPWAVQVTVMVALMCLLTIFSPDSSPRFIYFQF